ncbi:MAG TPA: sugar phosphate nucleotidyltransferase [Saprospiraceae bacterium]|nr:sugar phosphate nucleotidyltransferase [Saprospiraceae bacterium]
MDKKERISLVVLAAGMGSRYGGLKQMDSFGPNGETIIDYSLYDAHRAGFDHVVFIIRDFFAEKFKEVFEPKMKGRMATDYVYQELENIPHPFPIPSERERPWGTGHAVWVAHSAIKGPFAVINADDYYGPESYKTLYDFHSQKRDVEEYSVVGYKLDNTLSEHGAVNRGVCQVTADGYLEHITECKQIIRDDAGVISYPGEDGQVQTLQSDDPVSMNMWGFYPSYFDFFEKQFDTFLKENTADLKSEFYIPTLVDNLIKNKERQTKVLSSDAEWFGVTYREDKEFVSNRLKYLLDAGLYPYDLWK